MTATCTLTVTSGPAAGSEVEVEHELIIGRRKADLTIRDPELSRRHAAVRPGEAGVVVEDLGSLNGTFVDGERINAPVTLTADATVRVGTSEMSLQLAMVAAAPEAEEPADDSGRTRLATAVPQEPAPAAQEPRPIPQPQVTRVRPVLGAESPGADSQVAPQEPRPIPQPQVTRVRPVVPARGQAVARPDPAGSPGGGAQANPPGMFKRLVGRILGRGGGGR